VQRHGFGYRHGWSEPPPPEVGPDGAWIADRPGVLEGEVVSAGPVHATVQAAPAPSVAGTIGRSAAVVVLALTIFLVLLIFCVIH
jgi:hypothetical protein